MFGVRMTALAIPAIEAKFTELTDDRVVLRFARIVPGDAVRGFVPFYHYRIWAAGEDVGHINLRVGDTEHVRLCAGHVGFEIAPPYRGHRYALSACRALAPLARAIAAEHLITCDPDNLPSHRTIERLGAAFLDEVVVPENDPHYLRGSRTKLRFRWTP